MISEPILGIIMMCVMIFAIFIGFPVAFTPVSYTHLTLPTILRV